MRSGLTLTPTPTPTPTPNADPNQVRATSWEAEDWRVYEASKSFGEYFCTDDGPFLDSVDNPTMFAGLLAAVRTGSENLSRDLAVSRPASSSSVRTLTQP